MTKQHPAERRVFESVGGSDVRNLLADLSGTDFTTLLLAVMRERAARVTAPDLIRKYRDGRFARPSPIPLAALRKVEDKFLSALPEGWEAIGVSPVVPFATHSAMAGISQDRVLSAVRGTEVAADPTNSLALEAAMRRRAKRDDSVRLATIQRVVRGQSYGGNAPSHFSLFALVNAGRDAGGHEFEASSLVEHLMIHVAGIRAADVSNIRVLVTDLTGGDRESVLRGVEGAFRGVVDVQVVRYPEREAGRMYYEGICFKVRASIEDEELEVSDGGGVKWTARVLDDRREHLFISASSLDRLATN